MKYGRNAVLQILFLLKRPDGKAVLIFVGAAWALDKIAAGRCLFLTYPCPQLWPWAYPETTQGTAIFTRLPPHHVLLYAIHDINLCYDHKWEVNLQCKKILPPLSWVCEAGSVTAFAVQTSLCLWCTSGSSCVNRSLATEGLGTCTSGRLSLARFLDSSLKITIITVV